MRNLFTYLRPNKKTLIFKKVVYNQDQETIKCSSNFDYINKRSASF